MPDEPSKKLESSASQNHQSVNAFARVAEAGEGEAIELDGRGFEPVGMGQTVGRVIGRVSAGSDRRKARSYPRPVFKANA